MAKRKINVRESKPFEDQYGNRIVRKAHKREIEKKPELSKETEKKIKSGKPKRIPSNVYERNYDKISKIIDIDELKNTGFLKLKSKGFMDLDFDYLYKDDQGRHIIAMSHYYKHPSGDMIADPDMELRIDEDMGTIEALTYQDAQRYNETYSRDGKYVNSKVKKSLNSFLTTWLTNLKKQGFKDPYDSYEIIEYGKKGKKQLKIGKKYATGERGTGKPILTDNPNLAYTFKNKSEAESWLIKYNQNEEDN